MCFFVLPWVSLSFSPEEDSSQEAFKIQDRLTGVKTSSALVKRYSVFIFKIVLCTERNWSFISSSNWLKENPAAARNSTPWIERYMMHPFQYCSTHVRTTFCSIFRFLDGKHQRVSINYHWGIATISARSRNSWITLMISTEQLMIRSLLVKLIMNIEAISVVNSDALAHLSRWSIRAGWYHWLNDLEVDIIWLTH